MSTQSAPTLASDACDKPMVCGGAGERKIKINTDTGKLASEHTPESKIKEVVYRETHSILHYVNRADPLGPAPENPASDPQYALWEAPIQQWAEANDIVNQEPPTETDDQYQPEDKPIIRWLSPTTGDTIISASTNLAVDAQARRGVLRVDYFLDNVKVGTSAEAPFNYTFTVSPATPNGSYDLRAVAIDDIGNEASASVNISLQVGRASDEWQLSWTNITNNGVYTADELPDAFNLSITNPENISKIDFYLTQGSNRNFIGTQSISNEVTVSQSWQRPEEPGTYYLSMIITEVSGRVISYPQITITIIDRV